MFVCKHKSLKYDNGNPKYKGKFKTKIGTHLAWYENEIKKSEENFDKTGQSMDIKLFG